MVNNKKMWCYTKYLSQKHLQGFKTYKYSAIDTSPLSNYVMHPLWNFSVKLLPRWLAPNVLTFAGFLLVVAMVVLLGVYDYNCLGPLAQDGGEAVPRWVYIACGVFVFVAYNLDGMDGKQARRLGVSGPLGEMFDHGLDSYVVFFIPYGLLAVFGRHHDFTVPDIRGLLIVISVCLNFYISHWEKYNTGTLYLPWGYDISMWGTSLMYLLPGVYGPRVYEVFLFGDWTFVHVLEVVVHTTGLVSTLPIAVYNVYIAHKSGKNIQKNLQDMLRPVWAVAALSLAFLVWAVNSPGILQHDPKAFVLLYGTLFSNISCRLIVAEMSKQKCDVTNWMLWLLFCNIAVSFCVPEQAVSTMYATLVVCLIGHIHYGVCVVQQICRHLKINCFKVPKDKWK